MCLAGQRGREDETVRAELMDWVRLRRMDPLIEIQTMTLVREGNFPIADHPRAISFASIWNSKLTWPHHGLFASTAGL
jgi:hypothetical protein